MLPCAFDFANSGCAERSVTMNQPASADERFDPAAHRMCEQRWFEDFSIGERFASPSRTMTDALFAAFQLASGDNHPIHYDREFCRARGMPDMLAHGFQVLIQTAAGAGLFPHLVEDSLKGFIGQSSRFLAPVFVGDTLYCALEVTGLGRRACSRCARPRTTSAANS
jgi:acyl dehydratase